ncbi:NAD(P)-binding domain-containing protein [Novosphingobium sp. SG720]|uniref:ornithine cyclodeaminase family protein n=1 Tax=Novosphingobium sp. SG720 TaxID=2586998 RepID=UPI001445AF08|nr:NAD(P)-binding domain-containing protein [Novosphingobium sp. SG720]NKJ42309.1 ornithine cyclodeaminase/alanine dehydrogenase [Novosphingobium sp. SG720]
MLPVPQTLLLSDADVRLAFDWAAGVDALAAAYGASVAAAQFPPRTMARGNGLWLRTLSGVLPGQKVIGAKLIAASMTAQAASYLIPLFDGATMALTALLDGASVTGLRTAATSALAARRLCREVAPRVAVIGSGFEARTHLEALARSGALGAAQVFSPRETSRTAFCQSMAEKGIAVTAAESAEAAVAQADLVLCAARSRDESPTVLGNWLRPGMTVISIGSTLPEQRELDPEAIARADLIVADMVEEVADDTGDMIAANQAGVAFAHKLVSLEAVISGTHPGRTAAEQIVLYKSVGAAIQDLAIAALCVDRARAAGLGTSIPAPVRPVDKSK